MSSFDLDEIYKMFANPLEKQMANMRRQISRSRTQKEPAGDTKLDIASFGINSRNYNKVVNTHYNIHNQPLGTGNIFATFEPDYATNKLWINTDHFGREMEDDSEIPSSNVGTKAGQKIDLFGEPKLESGIVDRGYGKVSNSKKHQVLHFNRVNSPTRFQEYIVVYDVSLTDANKSFRIVDASSGATWIIRIRSDNFTPQNGFNQRLLNKYDEDAATNAIAAHINSSGQVAWQVRAGGVDRSFFDNSFTPLINTEYEYALVWNPAGVTDNDKMKLYRNGVLSTNTSVAAGSYGSTVTDHDLYIGKRGGTASDGYFQGYIILVKQFQGFQASAANLLSHWTNKLTVAGGVNLREVAVPTWSVPRNT